MSDADQWCDEKALGARACREMEQVALATTKRLLARCTRCDHLLVKHTDGCVEDGCDCRHTPRVKRP